MPRLFNPLEFNEQWLDRLSAADPYQPKEVESIDSRLRNKILELTDKGNNFKEFHNNPLSKEAGEFLDAYTQEYFPAVEEAARKAGRLSADEEAAKFKRMTGLDIFDNQPLDIDRLRAHDIYSHIRPYEAGLAPDYRENVVIKTNALPPERFRDRIKDLVGINRDKINKSYNVPNNPVTPFNENFAIINDGAVGSDSGIYRQPEYVKRLAMEQGIYKGMDVAHTSEALEKYIGDILDVRNLGSFPNTDVLRQSMGENYHTTSFDAQYLLDDNTKPDFLEKLKKQYSQIGELLSDKYFEPANKEIAKINALVMGTPSVEEGAENYELQPHDSRSRFNTFMDDLEEGQKHAQRVGFRQTNPSSYAGIPGRTFLNAVPPAAAAALGPIGDIVDIATGMQNVKSNNPVKKAAGVLNVGAGTSGIAALAGGINPLIPLTLGSVGATTEVLSDPKKRDAAFNSMRLRGPLVMPRY